MDLLEEYKVPLNDLSKLTESQIEGVKNSLLQYSGHRAIREVFYKRLNYEDLGDFAFDNSLLETMINNLVDILAKKLP